MELAKTLARTDDPETSKIAAEKMVKSGELSRQENEVLSVIEKMVGDAKDYCNFTTKDIAAKMQDYPYHKAYDICRKRFSGIGRHGKIELIWLGVDEEGKDVYKQRDGCRVWRLL